MDEIALRGIRAYGKHGAYAHERERVSPFDVDLTLELDLGVAASSDDLADTLDYAAVHREIVRVVRDTSFALLERLAAELARVALADVRVRSVEVSVSKPGLLNGATPSVTLVRTRAT